MCGVAGYFTEVKDERLIYLGQLLGIANVVRGSDSWGMFTSPDGSIEKGALYKTTDAISLGFARMSQRLIPKGLAMLHTRASTVGESLRANAHPFRFVGKAGTVVGAHNKYVDNHAALAVQYDRNFAVDSMHIFAHIADGLPMKEIEAIGTIEYVHDGVLHLSRFNGGELSCAWLHPEGSTNQNDSWGVAWSSEKDHLTASLIGAGIDKDEFTLYDMVNNELYEYTNGKLVRTAAEVGITRPFVKPTSGNKHSCSIGYTSNPTTKKTQRLLVPKGGINEIVATIHVVPECVN